jgi:rhodanese-related sulfurtransferase
MRRIVLSLLSLLAALALPAMAEKKMTAEEFKEALRAGNVYLLDVREPNELEESGAISGYTNIPLGQVEKRLNEIPKGKPILVYCMRGGRAAQASAILEKHGYDVMGSCGIIPWKDKGFDTVQPKK